MDKGSWSNICHQVDTCALTGASTFFAGIPDAAIVDNGPLWCYLYVRRNLENFCPTIENRFYCSQPDNDAVVYGTEDCLLEILQFIKEKSQPEVLLIENNCSISLIGDDLAGIARQAGLPFPVICLDCGSLLGGFWEGYRAAVRSYFSLLKLEEPRVVQPKTVNLLGCTPGYYNSPADLQELKRMLALVGCQVLACPGAGSSVAEIAAMGRAELNIVVHRELGLELAQILEKEYGMSYLAPPLPPYGIKGSLAWLQEIGKAIDLDQQGWQKIREEADCLERQIHLATSKMQRIWGELWLEKTVIAAPSSVALGMAKILRYEWVDTGELTVFFHDDNSIYLVSEGNDKLLTVPNDDPRKLEKELAQLSGGLLLGSSSEKALLQRLGVTKAVCQNIARPVYDEVILTEKPLMGLQGTCQMTEQLWNQYINFCQRA